MATSSSVPFSETEREREKVLALEIAAAAPQFPLYWQLGIQDASAVVEQAKYLVSVKNFDFDMVGFESFDKPPTAEDVYLVICRAVAYPMLRNAQPQRPERIYWDTREHHSLTKDGEEFLSTRLKEKLQIQLLMEAAPTEAPVNKEAARKVSASICYVCGAELLKRFCCSHCKAVKYCGRGCQIKDWPLHRKLCSLLKLTMEKSKELGEFPFTFTKEGYFTEDSDQPEQQALPYHGTGFWREEFLDGLPCPTNQTECEVTEPVDLSGITSSLLPFDKPLEKSSGFADTPKAIYSWRDFYRAKDIPLSDPAAMLLAHPLTLFHIIAHLCRDGYSTDVATASGSYLCIHLVNSHPHHPSMGPIYQLLLPLFPGVTLDIFMIHQDAHKPDSLSQEFKSEIFASCVRVHTVPTTYANFPVDQFPPDVVIGYQMSDLLSIMAQEELTKLMTNAKRNFFVENTELGCHMVRESLKTSLKLTPGLPCSINPFRQPYMRFLPSLSVPCYTNAFVLGYGK
ncbi:hypothetical protein K493DRAFT_312854 [Basidiobolus meristosporus CBS 931.73]|uniref:MYND-type domain-containing protein n=1 Tax=Basidiobolus meristosporus CBS 931.73 TaxID=1314790 RepID=A0A1Y1YRI0_9FUNG|nr:hypothetical protein K493DRAFT_312854 [Basidiobolus meristosporus CBS 931.73]|eukprot:ORY00424.1 hypothetical protein K493DRAFT_312854 [Basidiobolus meristosporus CBS 931.73]